VKKRDVILEVQSMLGCGWQIAKRVVALAEEPDPSAVRRINTTRPRQYMSQRVAAKHVQAAKDRIALIDEDEPADSSGDGSEKK